jgi:hypothetical protein
MANEHVVKVITRIADLIDSVCTELLEVQVGIDPIVFESSPTEGGFNAKRFSDIDEEPHIPQFDLIMSMLNTAILLTRKLSMGAMKGSKDGSFTPRGVATLTKDINDVNANGITMHSIATSLIKEYGSNSAKSESVRVLYNTAMELYIGLQREVPKLAVERGALPAVNRLKSLYTPLG